MLQQSLARPFAPAVAFRAHLLFHPDSRRSRLVRAFTDLLLREGRRLARPGSGPSAAAGTEGPAGPVPATAFNPRPQDDA